MIEPSQPTAVVLDQRVARLPWAIVVAAMVVTCVFMLGAWPRMNHDVAAIGLIAERMLAGDRLYVDLPEVNPPLVFLLTAIVVRVSSWMGLLWKETIVVAIWAWVALGSGLVGWVCERGRLLETSRARAALSLALFAIHVSLVGYDLGQREPMFLAAFLPLVFAGAVAARGGVLPRSMVVLIASFAALGLALKPFFVPFWLATELVFALHARRREVLLRLENLIVGGFMMAYGLYVVYLTPYLENLDGWLGSYSAYNAPHQILVSQTLPTLLVVAVGLLALWRGGLDRASIQPLDVALFVAAMPAVASVFVQAKGFSYHSWPLHALAMAGLLVVVLSQERNGKITPPSFSRRMGAVGLVLLVTPSVLTSLLILQPMAIVMTAFALLADRDRNGLKVGQDELGPGSGLGRDVSPWWAAISTWVFLVSILALGAARVTASWLPSVRDTIDRFQCSVVPYENPVQLCSFREFISVLEPRVQPGDGVLWVTSDAVPSTVVSMELQLRGVSRQPFMFVPAAYTPRDDPRMSHVYHDPEHASEAEQLVREDFIDSLANAKPRVVIFDRRAHGQAFGAVPFDTEQWFRADAEAAAALDARYTLLVEAVTVTRGTHVVYVRSE